MEKLTQQFVVTHQDTASALGSGDLEVLATPRLIAWMENTAMTLCRRHTANGETTVGISIQTSHTKAATVGAAVTVEATLESAEGRKLTLEITASDTGGNQLGTARHERFIVNSERFMSKL